MVRRGLPIVDTQHCVKILLKRTGTNVYLHDRNTSDGEDEIKRAEAAIVQQPLRHTDSSVVARLLVHAGRRFFENIKAKSLSASNTSKHNV